MTSNGSFLADTCSLLYPSKCCHQMIDDFNWFETECLKTVVSKTLGYGIIAGSTVVKLPQVIKIVNAKSGAGISVFGVIFELMAVMFGSAYGIGNKYPFTAWGESLFLTLETAAIAFFILFFDSTTTKAFSFLVAFVASSYVLVSGLTPLNILWNLQATNLPLVLIGKFIQATANYRNGHTGQLSAISFGLMACGSFARIFTTIRETGDILVVLIFVAATFANFVIVAQLVYYWKATNEFLKKAQKKKKN